MNKFYFIRITILVFLIMSGYKTKAETKHIPTGIMAFGWGSNFQNTKVFQFNYISGMTAYFGWNELQPEENRFDFSKIEKLLDKAKKNKKILNIGIYPGANAPEWLYNKKISYIIWKKKVKEDQIKLKGKFLIKKSPLPWDPKFLFYWKKFLYTFAKKYKNEKNIGYISLSGPVLDELGTGILIKDKNDFQKFIKKGYTEEKLRKAWIDIIDYYILIFGKKRLVIVLSPDRPGNPSIKRSTFLANYILEKNYTNISFLCVFLNDTWFEFGGGALKIRNLLKKIKRKNFYFGYQMAQSAYRNSKWRKNKPIVKNLAKSLIIGMADGASWIEVWHDDIIDPRCKKYGIPNLRYNKILEWTNQLFKSIKWNTQ